MDDRQILAAPVERYCCPGASHEIDRATHLGRLAAFYPACRQCVHRDDARELSAPQVRQWTEVLARNRTTAHFTAEGFEAGSVNEMHGNVAARAATALGIALCHMPMRAHDPPSVLVGSDGHWSSAELLAAACDALQLSGCLAIESSAATAPSLAAAAQHLAVDAAMWIGNATGEPHAVAVRFWGRAGRPWSSPGGLDAVRAAFDSSASRPRRRGGGLKRAQADETYLPPIAALFHALRPLRFVVDTTCQPLVMQLRQLTRQAACEVLRPAGCVSLPRVPDTDGTPLERRLRGLGREVIERQAHFGIWIDGCGERCRLVDERGRPVEHERLCAAMARYVLAEKPGATLLVDSADGEALCDELVRLGAVVVVAAPSRQATCEVMESRAAAFGSGPNRTFWFAGAPAAPDALLAASLVLSLLSQSDRACSEVLDAPSAAL